MSQKDPYPEKRLLIEALKPFAKLAPLLDAQKIPGIDPVYSFGGQHITAGDFYWAELILKTTGESKHGQED